MRLRTFEAAGVPEAMDMVRRSLGPDAVILSTQPNEQGTGVRVTAALEETPIEEFEIDVGDAQLSIDDVDQALAFHRVPPGFADRLLAATANLAGDDARMALAGALDALLSFAGRPAAGADRPLMLVGPPGAGKTATAAKLCALARLEDREASVITMDTAKAGGLAQITTFAETLGVDLHEAADEAAVARAVADCAARTGGGPGANDRLVVVDTVGANPFDPKERALLARTAGAIAADLALVLPGGGDAAESAEIAQSFAAAGARLLIATRLDAARRLGGVLAAARAGKLALLAGGISPRIAGGLAPLTPVALARLLLPPAEGLETPTEGLEKLAESLEEPAAKTGIA
jgi:flagellar biosynthesis protein FlhF